MIMCRKTFIMTMLLLLWGGMMHAQAVVTVVTTDGEKHATIITETGHVSIGNESITLYATSDIPTCATYAQSDPYERHIDSLGVSAETVEAREKTEYIATEPYQEFQLFYSEYKHLNISLNGAIKSVVQSEVPVSLLKKTNSSENIYVQQQTWKFSPTGHLPLCQTNKTFMKDISDYDINDDRTLSDDKYYSTHTIAYYSFNSICQISQVINELSTGNTATTNMEIG